jgi:hypothetical protein
MRAYGHLADGCSKLSYAERVSVVSLTMLRHAHPPTWVLPRAKRKAPHERICLPVRHPGINKIHMRALGRGRYPKIILQVSRTSLHASVKARVSRYTVEANVDILTRHASPHAQLADPCP